MFGELFASATIIVLRLWRSMCPILDWGVGMDFEAKINYEEEGIFLEPVMGKICWEKNDLWSIQGRETTFLGV